MRLFCFEDHNEQPPESNHERDLLEARASLARLRKLPLSAFAKVTHREHKFVNGQLIGYTVDSRDDAIARAEADVAELEVYAAANQQTKEEK